MLRRRLLLWALAVVGGLVLLAGLAVWYVFRSGLAPRTLASFIAKGGNAPSAEFLTDFLGFDKPQTYLVLFLNNTELRPGGGFIGAYALVTLERGRPTIRRVEGTELLDSRAPAEFSAVPPAPIARYLKVTKWYFRDSNWSPDFKVSAEQALKLYREEGGEAAAEISGVIGITASVLSELLKLTGPLTVQGREFIAENVIEKLEYEVEYGYAERAVPLSQRKNILAEFIKALLPRLARGGLLQPNTYLALGRRLIAEKQILCYAPDPARQAVLYGQGCTGELMTVSGDYLLWVDANLGALKTDHALVRSLRYALAPNPNAPGYQATVTLSYAHQGRLDWRTSRYRSYVRLYVPAESVLESVGGSLHPSGSTAVDAGEELGRHWVGTFITIEPQKKGELVFTFRLSPGVAKALTAGSYNLTVQKQLGTVAHGLTLDLDFGRTVTFARPPEELTRHGDARYSVQSDLRVGREFKVNLGAD